jgi:hypothetical protein
MHHVRCHIDGIAALQHLRSFAIGLQRERAIEFIVELMRIRVDVPGHRGARGEGVVLDVHFPAGLSSKVRDEKLLSFDLAGISVGRSMRRASPTAPATTRVEMRAFVGIMARVS